MKHLMIALTLVTFAPIAANAADRAAVAEQVAAQCRKDYPPPDYVTQLGCRKMGMDAFDELERQDRERAESRGAPAEIKGRRPSR
jgi:hypothetical protein